MNILIAIFEIQDYGGIVGHAEDLASGLINNGHNVDFVLLRNRPFDNVRKWDAPKNSNPSVLANEVNNLSGWYGCNVRGYYGKQSLKSWQSFASHFDLIIYEIPVPKLDNPDWKEVFNTGVKQISVIHDAHYQTMYPHLREVSSKLTGIAAVHPAAYYNMTDVDCPVAMIGNPIKLADWDTLPSWSERKNQIVCAHVWKAWKNMHQVVAAAPLVKHNIVLGGDGIEGRYMRSIDKCKPKYKGIWDDFLKSGHKYEGLISHLKLMDFYKQSKVMVDMSYSKKFVKYGSHFNRSVLESLNYGCVPLCTVENMREKPSDPPLFVKGEHYIGIKHDCSSVELASTMSAICEMDKFEAQSMVSSGRQILAKWFDRDIVARQYIDLAYGKETGVMYGI